MLCSSGWSEWHPAEKTFDMEGCVNLKSSIVVPVAFANSIRAALDTFHPSEAAQAGTHYRVEGQSRCEVNSSMQTTRLEGIESIDETEGPIGPH